MSCVKAKELGCLGSLVFIVIRLIACGYPWWLVVVCGIYFGLGLLLYLTVWEAISNDNNQK